MQPFRYNDLPVDIQVMVLSEYFSSEERATELRRDLDCVKSRPRFKSSMSCEVAADTSHRHKLYNIPISTPDTDGLRYVLQVRIRPTFEQLFVSKSFLSEAIDMFAASTTIDLGIAFQSIRYASCSSIITSSLQRILSHTLHARIQFGGAYRILFNPQTCQTVFQSLPNLQIIEVYDTETLAWHGDILVKGDITAVSSDRRELFQSAIEEVNRNRSLPKAFPTNRVPFQLRTGSSIFARVARQLPERVGRLQVYSLVSIKCHTKVESSSDGHMWRDCYVVSTRDPRIPTTQLIFNSMLSSMWSRNHILQQSRWAKNTHIKAKERSTIKRIWSSTSIIECSGKLSLLAIEFVQIT